MNDKQTKSQPKIDEVKITRWKVGPSRTHPGKLVNDKLVLGGGGESLRMDDEDQ